MVDPFSDEASEGDGFLGEEDVVGRRQELLTEEDVVRRRQELLKKGVVWMDLDLDKDEDIAIDDADDADEMDEAGEAYGEADDDDVCFGGALTVGPARASRDNPMMVMVNQEDPTGEETLNILELWVLQCSQPMETSAQVERFCAEQYGPKFMSPDLVWNKNCIMSVDTVLRARSLRLSHVLWLLENLMRFGFLGISQNEVHASRYKQVSKITEMIAFGAERLISTALMSGANNPKRTYEIPSVVRHMIFETPDYENDLVPFQSLVLYLLHVLFRNQYARYKGGIYEEIKHEGVPTRAWSRKYDMVTFIHDNTKKEVSFRQWKNMTMIYGRMRDIVKYLNNCQELEFPELKPDRHVFSFRNCVYFAKEDRTEAHENVPRHVVACKYFDMDFDETPCPPMDVPTPHFDKFFEAQKIGPDVMFWIYALMGRNLYDIGEMDGWEVCLFFQGVAGCGKSTILKIVRNVYNLEDSEVLSSTAEAKFGLGPLHDKYMWMCTEVTATMSKNVDRSDIQNMISGDPVSIKEKGIPAHTERWTCPGMCAGNEFGGWLDSRNQIARRFVLIECDYAVRNADTTLFQKIIDGEMANIIRKINQCYHSCALTLDNKDKTFWDICPQYFKDTQQRLCMVANPMTSFLRRDEMLVWDENAFVPFSFLKKAFQEFCKNENFRKTNFQDDEWKQAFRQHNISLRKETHMWDGNLHKDMYFCEGVTVQLQPGVRGDVQRAAPADGGAANEDME